MLKFEKLCMLLVLLFAFSACGSDEEEDMIDEEEVIDGEGIDQDDVPEGSATTGVFTDPRDGKQYRVELVNGLWWMMDNLAFDYPASSSTSSYWTGSLCDCNGDGSFNERTIYSYYDDKIYPPGEGDSGSGYLYSFDAAVSSAPAGWRLPTRDEWSEARKYPDNTYQFEQDFFIGALKGTVEDIEDGAAEQLLGVTYRNTSGSYMWTSEPRTISYPNGDDRDWYWMMSNRSTPGEPHYRAATVRLVTEAGNFTP